MDAQKHLTAIAEWEIGEIYRSPIGHVFKCIGVEPGKNCMGSYKIAVVILERLSDGKVFRMDRVGWHRKFKKHEMATDRSGASSCRTGILHH